MRFINGLPFELTGAQKRAVNEILNFLYEHSEIEQVNMVCYDDDTYKAYKKAYESATEH